MCNSIAHTELNWESMCNSIAHIWVLGAILEKKTNNLKFKLYGNNSKSLSMDF